MVSLIKSEKKVSSQNGENGVISEIFRRIKGNDSNISFVEIGMDSQEANMLFFADEKGARGTFLDADQHNTNGAIEKYKGNGKISIYCDMITENNINDYVSDDIDLLSIDIDGRDYFLWRSLLSIPKCVVIEYNGSIPRGMSLVNEKAVWDLTANFGASIDALIKLGESKGYSLVHTTTNGVNAFFVDNAYVELFPEAKNPAIHKANYFPHYKEHPNLDLSTFIEV